MSMSLRDQLLAAGLGNKSRAQQIEREQQKQRRNKSPQAPQAPSQAQKARAAQVARDQELNRKHREKAERKARAAEIRQLIEQHRVPRIESDDIFNFIDGRKIHRIAVNPETRARILSGDLSVVRYLGFHALVPAAIAGKIRERDEQAVVNLASGESASTSAEAATEDPYKDHPVPDDLMW